MLRRTEEEDGSITFTLLEDETVFGSGRTEREARADFFYAYGKWAKERHRHHLPCGHPAETAFDLVCQIDFRPFVRHPSIPFLLFVASIAACYFVSSRPTALYAVFSLACGAFIASVLRKRPTRAILGLVLFGATAVMSLSRNGSPDSELTGLWPLLAAIIVVVVLCVAFVQGMRYLFSLDSVRTASTIVVFALLASGLSTLLSFAFAFAHRLFPEVFAVSLISQVDRILQVLLRFRLEIVALGIAVAVVWSAAASLDRTREGAANHSGSGSDKKVGTGGDVAAQLLRTLRSAWEFARRFVVNWILELYRVGEGIIREAWALIGPTARVALILVLSLWGQERIWRTATVISEIWAGSQASNLRGPIEGLWLTASILALTVAMTLVLVFKHPHNLPAGAGFGQHLLFTRDTFTRSILLSVLLYSLFVGAAFYAAWWIIMPISYAAGIDSSPIGMRFIIATTGLIIIGGSRLLTSSRTGVPG